MKKLIPIIVLLSLSLTGCIEIVEEITVHSDGSGRVQYQINTSLGSLFKNLNSPIDESYENQIREELQKWSSRLEKREGIDSISIQLKGNLDDMKMGFSFQSDEMLNKALYSIFELEQKPFSPDFIKITDHKFTRKNFSPWIRKYFEQSGNEMLPSQLLDLVFFKSIIIFPSEIRKTKGTKISVSPDKRKIIQRNSLVDVFENKTSVFIKSRF